MLSPVKNSAGRVDPVTIEKVAALAGVSAGTVSRVLNGKNKENRPAIAKRSESIRRLALRLGYRPNVAARSMISGRFQAVAFVTCGDLGSDWYPISGLNGIHAALEKLQWRLMFTELPASKIMDPALVPQLFRETSVDGLLVNLLPVFSESIIQYFEAQPLPCVWLNLKCPLRAVYPDEISGSMLAIGWLLQQGHRRVGFFSRLFVAPAHFSVFDRFAGYSQGLKAAGLSAGRHLELISSSQAAKMPVLERAELFLRTFPDVEAVVCYEYEEAICLNLAAERLKRPGQVPIQLIAFHEREIRASSGISIQTVIVPFQEIGRQAVNMLQKILVENDRDVPSVAVLYDSILI